MPHIPGKGIPMRFPRGFGVDHEMRGNSPARAGMGLVRRKGQADACTDPRVATWHAPGPFLCGVPGPAHASAPGAVEPLAIPRKGWRIPWPGVLPVPNSIRESNRERRGFQSVSLRIPSVQRCGIRPRLSQAGAGNESVIEGGGGKRFLSTRKYRAGKARHGVLPRGIGGMRAIPQPIPGANFLCRNPAGE